MIQIDFNHLCSEVDQCTDGLLQGRTEWFAHHPTHGALSIAWDWIRLSDGGIQLESPKLVRTNIMVIDASGYDQGPENTGNACIELIRKLPWQRQVLAAVHNIK